jgi:hypothetical protein
VYCIDEGKHKEKEKYQIKIDQLLQEKSQALDSLRKATAEIIYLEEGMEKCGNQEVATYYKNNHISSNGGRP